MSKITTLAILRDYSTTCSILCETSISEGSCGAFPTGITFKFGTPTVLNTESNTFPTRKSETTGWTYVLNSIYYID
jgi:hypothetical protein